MRRNPVYLAFCFSFLAIASVSYSQQSTRTDILLQALQEQAAFEKKTSEELVRLSLQKGWPLTLTGPNGKYALLTGVDMLGYPIYTTTDNNIRAAATIRTSELWNGGSTGLNLSGSDASVKGKLGIWDGGRLRNTHQELTGRITQRDNPSSTSDHATHVAGTLIASGVNPLAKGMSYGMQELIAYDFSSHVSEMLTEAPNLLVSNHSYGAIAGWRFNDDQNRWEFWGQWNTNEDYKFGYYSSETQLFDSIAYNAPFYLIVKSSGNNRNENGPAVGANYWRYDASNTMINAGTRPAGISSNDGYDIISTYGTAKNILTVGAVNPIENGYGRPEDVVMSSFSSWGPTDDGRIKPDVVANGVNLVSSIATSDNAYANYSGTSMSSPNAAGSVLLLQEYYKRLHPGSPFLRASSLKGLVIHTADEAGSSAGPDYQHGWGLINMEKAAAVLTSNNTKQLLQENTLNNGTTFSLPVIASGEGVLKATLCWTDPKGSVETVNILNNTAPKLVHDLDLRIKSGPTTYLPWILEPASPASSATTGDNFRDNVEKIEVTGAVPGQAYTIEVTHKGTLERSSQVYSLIVSGVGGTAYCASAPSSTAGARIDSVSFGSLQKLNPAGCTGYNNFTNSTAAIESNTTVPYYIKVSSCDATSTGKIVKAFIDFNNDGDFTDAGENIATSGVINGNGFFSGNATIPALTSGNYTLMRVIVQETTDPANVNPCGTYSNGETQDFRIQVNTASKDVGIASIESPMSGNCADGVQYVSVKLQNYGRVAQSSIPVVVTVKEGSTTIANLSATYPGSIAAYGSVVYTMQTPFVAEAGKTYTITGTTSLSGDQNSGNNQKESAVTIASAGAGPAGQAEICGTSTVFLKVTSPVATDVYTWYSSAGATTPIATGANTSSTVITGNSTYFVSKNEQATRVGPANKSVFTDGGYNAFSGNFVRFTNDVPVVIKSVRLYIGNPGKIKFIVADISNFNETTGSYSYLELASKTIDVYATDPTPQAGVQTGNDPADLGAIFQLDLPVTETGSHAIIVQCSDGATIFRNNNIPSNPYPFSIPGVFSITGNSAVLSTDPVYYQKFYYFFYDMKIDAGSCPSARTSVVATNGTAPTITANGNDLTTASPAVSYQWYLGNAPIAGANLAIYTASQSGLYKVQTTDAFGCQLFSNEINLTVTSIPELNAGEIGLRALPNPNNGSFVVEFKVDKKSDMSISLQNMLGQDVYRQFNPDFIGTFNQQLNPGKLGSGVYLLRIDHGGKVYLKKILISE